MGTATVRLLRMPTLGPSVGRVPEGGWEPGHGSTGAHTVSGGTARQALAVCPRRGPGVESTGGGGGSRAVPQGGEARPAGPWG